MHRRPVRRSRRLAAIGALVALAGCFLPWWTKGGASGLPVLSGTAFESLGIVVFAAAIATLALVTLPYALIVIAGWLAFAYRLFDLASSNAFTFAEPADIVIRIPGLWLVGIGLGIISRATYEMLQEPQLR
jgi:hypothetical protein